mmetsp:Transcript_24780/g.58831  ORF Transcript_24780/g.58831 Transcript_24780/m.58831 type:complete len:231 (-) Transcript_24780:2758-3450(-)
MLIKVTAFLDLRIFGDQLTALSLRQMDQKRDEASVIRTPANDAISHRKRKSLGRFSEQTQHAGTEVGRHEHAHSPIPGLVVNSLIQVLTILLLKFGFKSLDLLRCLAGNNLNDGLLVCPHSIHGCLQVLAVQIVVHARSRMRALEHGHQDVLEIAACLRLDVLNQILPKHPLVGLLDDLALLEAGTNNDADQLVFSRSPPSHSAVKSCCPALGPLHGLKLEDLLVIEGCL